MALLNKADFQASLQQTRVAPVRRDDPRAIAEASRPPPPPPKRPPVAKNNGMPSVAEYRGTSALANVKPSKNYSSDARHTSLAFADVKPETRVFRQPNDITQHQTNALLTGSGNIFAKTNCTTSKGWKPGRFM